MRQSSATPTSGARAFFRVFLPTLGHVEMESYSLSGVPLLPGESRWCVMHDSLDCPCRSAERIALG